MANPRKSIREGSSIRPCSCKHSFQDSRYGKGMRVHNRRTKEAGWRCTVCGSEKAMGYEKITG